jgi:hypothetical protein
MGQCLFHVPLIQLLVDLRRHTKADYFIDIIAKFLIEILSISDLTQKIGDPCNCGAKVLNVGFCYDVRCHGGVVSF